MNPAKAVRALLESIRESDASALRDCALLAVIACPGARASAVAAMDVQDLWAEGHKGLELRKSGALRDLPVDHTAERCVDAYLDASGIAAKPDRRCGAR